MRRVSMLAVLFFLFASCAARPAFVDGQSPAPAGPGTKPRMTGQPRAGGGTPVCREISRSRCDTAACKGANLDLVTLSCDGATVTRCEVNTACGS
jgi:hypothetical protein